MKQRQIKPRATIIWLGALGYSIWITAASLNAAPDLSGIEIISPSHPKTLDVGGCPKMSERLSWDDKAGMLRGIVTYSTVVSSGEQEIHCSNPRTFVLAFPTVSRSEHDELYVRSKNRKVAVGHLQMNSPGHRVRTNSGVNFIAHRVEGRLGGEIIVSPAASTVSIH